MAGCLQVEFPVASLDAFLDSLVEIALMTDCKSQLESVVRMIGSLINKWRDGKTYIYIRNLGIIAYILVGAATSAYVEKLSSSLQNLIDQSSDQASNALAIYLWVSLGQQAPHCLLYKPLKFIHLLLSSDRLPKHWCKNHHSKAWCWQTKLLHGVRMQRLARKRQKDSISFLAMIVLHWTKQHLPLLP